MPLSPELAEVERTTRCAIDIAHAVNRNTNEEGRTKAVAFVCATAGLKAALEATPQDKRAISDFHKANKAVGPNKLPNVTISCRNAPAATSLNCVPGGGQEIRMDMVRSTGASVTLHSARQPRLL